MGTNLLHIDLKAMASSPFYDSFLTYPPTHTKQHRSTWQCTQTLKVESRPLMQQRGTRSSSMKPSPPIGYRTSYCHSHNSNTSLHSATSKDIRMLKPCMPNFPYWHNSMLMPIASPRDIELRQTFNSISFRPSQAVMHVCS